MLVCGLYMQGNLRRTVTECHDAIQCIKDDWMINHSIIVEFAKVLDLCKSSLVEFEIILFQPDHDILQDIVDDCCNEVLMVTVQSTSENCKKMNITILDFSGFGEDLLEYGDNLSRFSKAHWNDMKRSHLSFFPMKSPNLLQNLGVISVVHIEVDKLANE